MSDRFELRGDSLSTVRQVLTIERIEVGDSGTPADGDLLLSVTIGVGAYAATDEAWVMACDWREFMDDLRGLEQTRRGQATLRGASPQDLELTFKATGRAGHMSVSGFVGWNSPDGFYQRCEFGFGFDAGLLGTVLRDLETLASEPGSK